MKKSITIAIPLLILIGTIITVNFILSNPPEAKKGQQSKSSQIPIEIKKLKKEDYIVNLESYGIANASTKTNLTSQVSGKIIYVNKNLKDGSYFKKGELLLQIEDDDYKAEVKVAQAELILAKQALLEEQAKSKQAKEDWKKFNIKQKPNPLVLRIPQLESAKATLSAAEANLKKAELNLKRTRIIAPYDGRVVEKLVSIAQVVSSNTQLATIFSNESIEVRLPIKNKELNLIDLKNKSNVKLFSNITSKTYKGKIVRSESSLDSNTKQLYLISQISDTTENITLGEYLSAKIEAKKLHSVIVIPNSSIYQSSYVYTEENGKIRRKNIEIFWQDNKNSLIKSGLKEDEHLVITSLGLVSSGTKVKVIESQKKEK